MRRRPDSLGAAGIWVLLVCLAAPAGASELTPKEILDRVDDLFRGDSSHGKATLTVRTENWSRSLTMEFWSRGKDHSLIRILEPKKEKGTATLKAGRDLWNYLPKVKRVVKLPSSMMSASWMGSHFTNDDLVRESRMADDYPFEITFEGSRDGSDIIEITCTPKPEAPVDESQQQQVAEQTQDLAEHRERVAAAGGELLGAVFHFLGELVSQNQAPTPADPVVSSVRDRLSQCVEQDSSGRQRLTVTLPDRAMLDNLAQTLARLMVVGTTNDGASAIEN